MVKLLLLSIGCLGLFHLLIIFLSKSTHNRKNFSILTKNPLFLAKQYQAVYREFIHTRFYNAIVGTDKPYHHIRNIHSCATSYMYDSLA